MSDAKEGQAPEEVFVICSASDIDSGAAKAFDLMHVDDEGTPRPFRILVAKNGSGEFFAYRNSCPHQGAWLNIGAGTFFDESGALLKCGRHGAKFEIETGKCVSGECENGQLQIVPLLVLDGDVCIHSVKLVEEDGLGGHWDDMDETMEITIPG